MDQAPLTPAAVAQSSQATEPGCKIRMCSDSSLSPPAAWSSLRCGCSGGALRPGTLSQASAGLAVGLIAADLLAVTVTFHPYSHITDLRPHLPDVLLQQASAPFRVYTPPTAEEKRTQVEPNRLLVAGHEEANGYSSLDPDRNAAYVDAIQYVDTQLLDLWNARFVLRRVAPQLFPSYAGVSFHPERPLVSGKGAGADDTLVPEGGEARASAIRLVARLWSAGDVPDGATVATVRPAGKGWLVRELPRCGRAGSVRQCDRRAIDHPHLSARGGAGGLPVPALQSQRLELWPTALLRRPGDRADDDGSTVTVHLDGVAASVFGIGLVDPSSQEVTQVREKARYQKVYEDREIRVFENTAVMPRAFLVADAFVQSQGQSALTAMRDGMVDLRRTAVLECPVALAAGRVSARREAASVR